MESLWQELKIKNEYISFYCVRYLSSTNNDHQTIAIIEETELNSISNKIINHKIFAICRKNFKLVDIIKFNDKLPATPRSENSNAYLIPKNCLLYFQNNANVVNWKDKIIEFNLENSQNIIGCYSSSDISPSIPSIMTNGENNSFQQKILISSDAKSDHIPAPVVKKAKTLMDRPITSFFKRL